MNEDIKKLKELIESSQRILITSHISPDPDAVSSELLLGSTLEINFPRKQVKMALEEEPSGLDFLEGYKQIKFGPVYESANGFTPDLFILLDGNNYERCSRHDSQKIRDFIREKSVKTAIIDHHELAGYDQADVFINRKSASTVQDVWGIFFDGLGLKQPSQAAQTAMTGFYADTGGFVYVKAGQQQPVFGFAEKLVSLGADIEYVKNKLESYTESDMKILGELAANVSHESDYSYSFLSDGFIEQSELSPLELQRPMNSFLNSYIRNIGGRRWGFVVYKNTLQGKNFYSVSFRSQGGDPDISVIAASLGGGGHKGAAGAKFEAGSLNEAVDKVKKVIMEP